MLYPWLFLFYFSHFRTHLLCKPFIMSKRPKKFGKLSGDQTWSFFKDFFFKMCFLGRSRGTSSHPSTSSRASHLSPLSREETAELQQLARLIPVGNSRNSSDPCAVLRAAALYIDQLRTTVAARVRNGSLPRGKFCFCFSSCNFTIDTSCKLLR